MPTLPDKKVGLIACSGEDLPEGTVSRMATLRVLETLRPADTVTLCLPLFLAGEERERAFARFYPTIAIDGCDKRCAARATEHYSGRPAASLVVSDIVAAEGLPQPGSARRVDAAGERAAEVVAAAIADEVDRLLPRRRARVADVAPAEASAPDADAAPMVPATCSCGSGIAVGRIAVNGRSVELVALPLILDLFRQEGRPPSEATADALFETVATYNAIEAADAPAIRAAVLREYELFCAQSAGPATARQEIPLMPLQTYHADVTWTGEHRGEVRLGNGPVLPFSAPPDAHGHEGVLTPEDAFVAAANTCVMMMFLWACERLKIDLVSYECAGEGTKRIDFDRTEQFTHVVLRPRIVVRGGDQKRIERALQSALKYSLVANSIKSELTVEPTVVFE